LRKIPTTGTRPRAAAAARRNEFCKLTCRLVLERDRKGSSTWYYPNHCPAIRLYTVRERCVDKEASQELHPDPPPILRGRQHINEHGGRVGQRVGLHKPVDGRDIPIGKLEFFAPQLIGRTPGPGHDHENRYELLPARRPDAENETKQAERYAGQQQECDHDERVCDLQVDEEARRHENDRANSHGLRCSGASITDNNSPYDTERSRRFGSH